MKTQYSNAVRWGVVVSDCSDTCARRGTSSRGTIDATRDAQGFVQAATALLGAGWVLVSVRYPRSSVSLRIGALSQPRGSLAALAGLVLSILGTALFLSLAVFWRSPHQLLPSCTCKGISRCSMSLWRVLRRVGCRSCTQQG